MQLRSLGARLTKGQPLEVYVHTAQCAATLTKLLAPLDKKSGQRVDGAKPLRSLPPQSGAVVVVTLERAIAVECHADCKHLGRMVLRDAGETIAAGLITAILA